MLQRFFLKIVSLQSELKKLKDNEKFGNITKQLF